MTPAEGRRNVLAQLRRRWPQIQERATPRGALAAVLADLPSPDGSALAALKPRVDHIAGKWTTTREYYSGLTSSRDLEAALRLVQPEVTPLAVDLAFAQTRGDFDVHAHGLELGELGEARQGLCADDLERARDLDDARE